MAVMQQQQMQLQEQQQQAAMQIQQAQAQAEAQKLQAEGQVELQKIKAKAMAELEVGKVMHEFRKEIEIIKAQATLGFKTDDKEFKEKIEVLKEDRKDERVKKQAVQQSKLLAQRKDQRGPMVEPLASLIKPLKELQ
jgi:regulator of protease activity HflC (stomatin/prohibitin superfamily)